MPIEFDIKRLSLAGKLTGLNLQNPGNLKVIPYGLGQVARNFELEPTKTDFDSEFGVDVKYSITSNMTLDLTYNTDFAQVEVDEQQINLDRFNLFFPEKRPFFLENAGLFSIGSPGEIDLFFSRRIGIGEEGELVPIIGGARLSGKINNTNVGFLSMFTDNVDTLVQKNNFTVGRINQQFGTRSSLGAAFINREGMGSLENDYNRVYSADGKLGLGKKAQLSGFYAQSSTPGISDDEHAFRFQAQYEWNGFILSSAYTEVAEGFNPEMGFLSRQSAFRKPEFLIFKRIRASENSPFLEFRPHVSYRGFWNFSGFQETGFLHVDNHWEWKNGLEIHTGINFTTEGVVSDFEIFAKDSIVVSAGTYKHREVQIIIRTNQSKPIYASTRSVLGGSFGGERYLNSGTLGIRLGDKFNSEFRFAHNDFRLPNGNFTTDIFGARFSYSFTPSILAQSLVQYNSVADIWSTNIRFSLLKQANSGLFVVYNETRSGSSVLNRSFIVKYSIVIDVLK